MLIDFALVVAGLLLLVGGGEGLVRGAARLALLARVPPALVGLTVVAAGTSSPELVVSVSAALAGSADLSMGNVVGSNMFNIGLILGISALIKPLQVQGNTVRLEWPLLAIITVQLHLLARDGMLDRLEGGFFLMAFVVFIAWTVRIAGRDMEPAELEEFASSAGDSGAKGWAVAAGLTVLGIALLILGAKSLITGAVDIARAVGVSERVIGLSLVAFGTSLPELFTSVVAAWRGQTEIAVANVIGSNIFNVLLILGATAVIRPMEIHPEILAWDNWWMIAFTMMLFPLMYTGLRIARSEGALLLIGVVIYCALLFLG